MSESGQSFLYDAFISYRHVEKDRKWAEWLISALEGYRVPKSLQAKGYPARPAGRAAIHALVVGFLPQKRCEITQRLAAGFLRGQQMVVNDPFQGIGIFGLAGNAQ